MLALTRERLVERLVQVPELADAYAARDPDYPDRGHEMAGRSRRRAQPELRNPLVSLVAAERANIEAIDDGVVPSEVSGRGVTRRKSKRAAASLALARTEAALRGAVREIDDQFDRAREKLSQLLAVASGVRPIPLPPTQPRHDWLDEVWNNLGDSSETQGMFRYLAARLAQSDRRYLLDQVLDNLLSNTRQ